MGMITFDWHPDPLANLLQLGIPTLISPLVNSYLIDRNFQVKHLTLRKDYFSNPQHFQQWCPLKHAADIFSPTRFKTISSYIYLVNASKSQAIFFRRNIRTLSSAWSIPWISHITYLRDILDSRLNLIILMFKQMYSTLNSNHCTWAQQAAF